MGRTAWPTVNSGDAWLFGQHNQFGRDNDLAYWKGVAAGDTEYYDSATTRARIPIGTAGQQLAVNAGATAPEWVTGEAMQLIESFTAAGGEASYTFSAIPQTFRHLKLFISGRSNRVNVEDLIIMEINDDTGANYAYQIVFASNNIFTQLYFGGVTNAYMGHITAASAPANYPGIIEMLIPNYTNATFYKTIQAFSSLLSSGAIAGCVTRIHHGLWKNTVPITKTKVYLLASTFAAGCKISLYGLK